MEELRRLALVHGLEADCDDRDELSALLLSFFSFADRRTVFVNELRDAFPSLREEGDLIASLLESTDLRISHELLAQLAEISDSCPPFAIFRPDQPLDVFAQIPGCKAVLVHAVHCPLTRAHCCRCFGRGELNFGWRCSPPCHLLPS